MLNRIDVLLVNVISLLCLLGALALMVMEASTYVGGIQNLF